MSIKMLKTGLTCIYEQHNDFLFEYLSNGLPNCIKVAREHFFHFDELRSVRFDLIFDTICQS